MPEGDLASFIEIICRVGGIEHLSADQDFYEAGVSSFSVLPLLMEMEDRFQVRIPDDRFLQAHTAGDLQALITDLKKEQHLT